MKVFVNGTFDILHMGHLDLLNYAKSLGTYLLVAVDSDNRVTEKKGSDRPFNKINNRVALLSNLKAVDKVLVFNSDIELESIIEQYNPDIMLVGSDWKNKKVIGSEYAKELVFFDRVIDESTTKTIENYINRRHLH
jgi:D-beta-D-heptose 7-phosphate kinase/D-beta-D-heptose 1-phosphate adenosyltransferase